VCVPLVVRGCDFLDDVLAPFVHGIVDAVSDEANVSLDVAFGGIDPIDAWGVWVSVVAFITAFEFDS